MLRRRILPTTFTQVSDAFAGMTGEGIFFIQEEK